MANPAPAVISESKRFPVIWDYLATRLPTWRALLPETRPLRDVDWACGDDWLLKSAICNNGDAVIIRDSVPPARWLRIRLEASLWPGHWVAQRRFEPVPIWTPEGMRHVCVGIFTVNGKAAGAYARVSEKTVIDYAAVDAALLLDDDD